MQRETKLRALSERILQSTLSTLPRRPLPVSAHQAAEDLYDALDRYAAAISANQQSAAKAAIERLNVEAMRVLIGYELPQAPSFIDNVRVDNNAATNPISPKVKA